MQTQNHQGTLPLSLVALVPRKAAIRAAQGLARGTSSMLGESSCASSMSQANSETTQDFSIDSQATIVDEVVSTPAPAFDAASAFDDIANLVSCTNDTDDTDCALWRRDTL